MVTGAEDDVEAVVKSWPVGSRGWVDFYRQDAPGHIFNIARTEDGVLVIEAQILDSKPTLTDFLSQVRLTKRVRGRLDLRGTSVHVTRVDDLEFNEGVLEAVTWTGRAQQKPRRRT
jgi:hypothetical protein